MPSLYLDSNVFIYALEGEGDVAARCNALLSAIRAGDAVAFTSELTLAEVLVRPDRLRKYNLKRAYLALLGQRRSIIRLQPVTRAILVESATYRARVHPMKPDPTETKRNFLPDAIHVVTAMHAEAEFFVGGDTRLRLPEGMNRLVPRKHDLVERLGIQI